MRITFLRPALMTAAIVASAGILAGGLALRPAFAVVGSAMVNPFTTCSKTTPCKKYSNSGTGTGLQGTNTNASTSGAGLIGTATSNGTGVAGQTIGGIGVFGSSSSSIGVLGSSSSNAGAEGVSISSVGVVGATGSTSPSIAGVLGVNNGGSIGVEASGFGGPLFLGNNSSNNDVFEVDDAGNTSMSGTASITGLSGSDALDAGTTASYSGVAAQGSIGVAGFGVGANPAGVYAVNDATSYGAALVVQDESNTGVLVNGYDVGGNLKLQVGDDGTVYAHNFVVAFDTPTHQKVTNYATTSSTPNIEDFGEAQLTGGQTYVSLRRAYATEIDSRLAYMVFITPEGDTRGLYVTEKTPAGFVVRENQGGRSDALFSYRIVAKQYGSTTAMLRPGTPPPHRPHLLTMAKLHHAPKFRIKAF